MVCMHVEQCFAVAVTMVCADGMMLQGLWTDGHLAFTVALDQRLHFWRLQHQHVEAALTHAHSSSQNVSKSQPAPSHAAEKQEIEPLYQQAVSIVEGTLGKKGTKITASLGGSAVTQVLEPAALDAVYDSFDETYHVLIAGRGTQLLSMAVNG